MSISQQTLCFFSCTGSRSVFCAYGYISCITKYQMSVLSRDSLKPTDKQHSGQCAPDVAVPWLHAYPGDQMSAGVAFCQLQRCKICKEEKRGCKNKQRKNIQTESGCTDPMTDDISLRGPACSRPDWHLRFECVGVCGRNLDSDQWRRCQGDSNCTLR